MRRFLGFLLLLGGLGLVYGWPWYQRTFNNFEIGTYRIYDEAAGYTPVSVAMTREDAPVVVKMVARAKDQPIPAASRSNVAMVVTSDGTNVATPVTILDSPPTVYDPANSAGLTIENDVMTFSTLTGGLYTFTPSQGDLDAVPLESIDLVLTGRVAATDESLTGTGYTLLAIGGFLFLFGGRRRASRAERREAKASRTSQIGRAEATPPPAPEKPKQPSRKWGRGDS